MIVCTACPDGMGAVAKEVRSQYRISRIISRDAILDILAENREDNLTNNENSFVSIRALFEFYHDF